MRPSIGVLAELAALAAILILGRLVPQGLPFGLYVVIAELAATYLVHCPAHYLVGVLVGIRFRRIGFGRTALAKVLPGRFSALAKVLPVLTLSTVKSSLMGVPRSKVALMYAAGTVASVSIALAIATVATTVEPIAYSSVAWVAAFGYLVFDLVFSPKSGDFARARAALTRDLREPVRAQER